MNEIDTPRVEGCIEAVMKRFPGESPAALARYYHEVHQHLGPLARELERELARLRDLLNRRPAMNAGLTDAYASWTTEVYDSDMGALSQRNGSDHG